MVFETTIPHAESRFQGREHGGKKENREAKSANNAKTIKAVWRNNLHRSMHELAMNTMKAGSDNTVSDFPHTEGCALYHCVGKMCFFSPLYFILLHLLLLVGLIL